MANFSPYYATRILQHTFGQTIYTPPSTLYVGLCTSLGSGGSTYAEVPTGTAYARQVVIVGTPSDYPVRVVNPSNIDFPQSTTPWGPIGFAGIFDAATDGNLLIWAALTTVRTIVEDQIFRISANELAVQAY